MRSGTAVLVQNWLGHVLCIEGERMGQVDQPEGRIQGQHERSPRIAQDLRELLGDNGERVTVTCSRLSELTPPRSP